MREGCSIIFSHYKKEKEFSDTIKKEVKSNSFLTQ